MCINAGNQRKCVKCALESFGIGDLRDEANVGKCWRFAKTKTTLRCALCEDFFERLKPFANPVAIPAIARGIVDSEFLRQVIQHTQIVDRMNVAGTEMRIPQLKDSVSS